ncbi:MAG TPA: hypothetical protein VFN61_02910 [Acidimicrobiales bacterium]|nr:hypothetical protein [Acidimicrobiales bacterium]
MAVCHQARSEQDAPAGRWARLVNRVESALRGSDEHSSPGPTGRGLTGRGPTGRGLTADAADFQALALTLAGYNGADVAALLSVPLTEVRREIRRGLAAVASPVQANVLSSRRSDDAEVWPHGNGPSLI